MRLFYHIYLAARGTFNEILKCSELAVRIASAFSYLLAGSWISTAGESSIFLIRCRVPKHRRDGVFILDRFGEYSHADGWHNGFLKNDVFESSTVKGGRRIAGASYGDNKESIGREASRTH